MVQKASRRRISLRVAFLVKLWRIVPIIPALRKLKQENYKFEASLG